MRAVFDPNVLISAVLSPGGAPAELLRAWRRGAFELVASPLLLAELTRALGYPKLRRYVSAGEARELVSWLERAATVLNDPRGAPAIRSTDPGDDYLIALASEARAVLVSGDRHLLALADDLPVYSVKSFLAELQSRA